MQIDIPDELLGRLRLRMAPGASEVDALRQVLDDVDGVNLEPLSEHELAESLAMLDRSMEEVRAGRSISVVDARRQTRRELGFTPE